MSLVNNRVFGVLGFMLLLFELDYYLSVSNRVFGVLGLFMLLLLEFDHCVISKTIGSLMFGVVHVAVFVG